MKHPILTEEAIEVCKSVLLCKRVKSVKDREKRRIGSGSATLYDYPDYYELAFSVRDISQEVTCFEQLFERYAKVTMSRVVGWALPTLQLPPDA